MVENSMARRNLSNKGRIHLRRPTCQLHFSLAEWRRTIHLLRRSGLVLPLTIRERWNQYSCLDCPLNMIGCQRAPGSPPGGPLPGSLRTGAYQIHESTQKTRLEGSVLSLTFALNMTSTPLDSLAITTPRSSSLTTPVTTTRPSSNNHNWSWTPGTPPRGSTRRRSCAA
jgi:hypothetical protein